MADNFVAACEQAAEALLSFQNITRNDVQRLAASMTENNAQANNQTTLRSELARRFPSYRPATASLSPGNLPSTSNAPARQLTPSTSNKRRGKTASKKPVKKGRPASSNIVYRDLVIIPDPETKKVPTHSARVLLEKNKLIVSGFPFDRSWDAVSLKSNIRKQLPQEDMSFQYVKACYGSLVVPKLANGFEITTDAILKISGQGAVYVRLLDCKYDIYASDTDSECDENELVQTSLNFSSGTTIRSRNHPGMINSGLTDHQVVDLSDASVDNELNQTISELPDATIDGLSSELPVATMNGLPPELPDATMNELSSELPDATMNELSSELPDATIDGWISELPDAAIAGEPSVPSILDSGDAALFSTEIQERLKISLHRANLKAELISAFEQEDIMTKFLVVKMINEHGNEEKGEGGGVTRDALSLFWQEAYVSLMLGEDERVPCIRHDMKRNHWQAVARIFLKGFIQEKYFPIQISQVFLVSLVFGEDFVSREMYLESFKRYMSRAEADIVEQAISVKISLENEDFLDVLSAFECKKAVNEKNICDVLVELAHKELVQKPKYVADCWEDILRSLKMFFPTVEALQHQFASLQPTPAKICRMFISTPETPAEAESIAHLKRWVKGLDDSSLRKFLRLSTGADVVIGSGIQVTFTSITGASRCPVFHTCGNVLELPSTYDDFCDFRKEFTAILSQKDIEMDLV